jgi:tRNA modification GTPase
MLTLAHVEAHLDFPDEDIAPDTRDGLLRRLGNGIAFMDELLRTADEGQILRRGIRAAIIGRPNAGKSSLLNQLLGRDRAIVSPIAGTTRDTIEEMANLRGLPVIFIDTAGLREARDEIELEGIRRSRESLVQAEFILHVLDASEPLTTADENYFAEFAGKKRILVRNKTDLPVKLGRGRLLRERAGDRSPERRHQIPDLVRRDQGGDAPGDDQFAASGGFEPRPHGGPSGRGGLAHGRDFGTGGDGSAHRHECGR